MKYDTIIIGAGAAGIATAELMSRNGKNVLLLESNDKVACGASVEHHGWYHMGSLYAIIKSGKFMKACVKGTGDLLAYYAQFPRMNLSIDTEGNLKTNSKTNNNWFTGQKIHYVVACHNDQDFKNYANSSLITYLSAVMRRLAWHFSVRRFVKRHVNYHNYQWSNDDVAIKKVTDRTGFMKNRSRINKLRISEAEIDQRTHIEIEGFDQTMNSELILSDLLNAFIKNGGELKTNSCVTNVKHEDQGILVFCENATFCGSNVIVCCGKWTDQVVIGESNNTSLKKTMSPLMVVHPKICAENFVRLTPFVDRTINHIIHKTNDLEYSVIGSGFFTNELQNENENEINKLNKLFTSRVEEVFPKLHQSKCLEIYWGTKTENSNTWDERNYAYSIEEKEPNIWQVVPGKFSLIFSLAIQVYKTVYEDVPSESGVDLDDSFVDNIQMRHADIINKNVKIEINKQPRASK